jgi:hypothetical protein
VSHGESSAVSLKDLPVSGIKGTFFVPAYQRGYRWGPLEVERLLDDISESGDSRYYLQPIVVKSDGAGRWELVDGQQRLTTLYLILRHIHTNVLQQAAIGFSLEYDTRAGSQAYLDDPSDDRAGENIDYFHINRAARTIANWFDRQPEPMHAGVSTFTAFKERVRIIWYEAAQDVSSTNLFIRLNVGRIPLTDAELVKALILAESRSADGSSDRSREIAAQWDAFERDLADEAVWAFATAGTVQSPTRISLLLDSLAGTTKDSPPFRTFDVLRREVENRGAKALWDDIVDLHSLIMGWYDERPIFHKVGFLTATGVPFKTIVDAAHKRSKNEFLDALDDMIRQRLNLSLEDLGTLEYGTTASNAKAERALLLMNVETINSVVGSSERFAFDRYASGEWSLEHIHAQSSPRLTADEQREWLAQHRAAILPLQDLSDAEKDDLVARIDAAIADVSQEVFAPLQREIVELLSEPTEDASETMHSLRNLALLMRGDNSALSHGAFLAKRNEIIRLDQAGSYIPACTRNVFLKYYTPSEAHQIRYWGHADREAYFARLVELLQRYLIEPEAS